MNESNPYEAPDTDLQTADEIGDPRGVEAGRGMSWISEGFGMFKQSPLTWILLVIVMFVIQIVLAFIPVIGQIAGNIIWPIFTAGIMAGCAAMDEGDELTVGHLFAGFSEKMGPLLGLGAMYFVMVMAVGIVVGVMAAMMGIGMAGLAGTEGGIPGGEATAAGGIAIAVLVGLALFLPVVMAIWFAPALMMLADKGVFESLKLSFIGCLKNIMPFLIYGIVALILLVIAMIPVGLGLLIMFPVLMAAMYIQYKDIYGA
ncbi:MAG: BPSS1780 family membrane protein [Gammaproteobacteria bacterium]|nr:BPSS1780 family membrane protein [Gammaproteobacteria bacterium]